MEKNIEALSISRIKDINDVYIRPNAVLIKVVDTEEDRRIIVAEGTTKLDGIVWEVLKVGNNITDYKVGQIIIDMNTGGVSYYLHNKDKYIVADAYHIIMAVDPDNYEK